MNLNEIYIYFNYKFFLKFLSLNVILLLLLLLFLKFLYELNIKILKKK
jgi:hypothetical protein